MTTENIPPPPFYIQINEPGENIHITNNEGSFGMPLEHHAPSLPTMNSINTSQVFVDTGINPVKIVETTSDAVNPSYKILGQEEQSCVFQIVYPQELNLQPAYNVVKRGRPKKKKTEEVIVEEKSKVSQKLEVISNPPKSARTRSGRLVKLPKHIEQNFKKIEITSDEQDIQVTDFKRFEEKENTKLEFPPVLAKKRIISARYKCPKCSKAYLGKNKMLQHLKKYPDHGPLPEGFQEFNFDVWNYLFDITQKCKPGQRGVKFCEELSNLLHNVQLLKSALFKTVTDNKNCVTIDKVLGNAIGLAPGKYKFDENELYKDVTVLKLITNTEFFKPNFSSKKINESETGSSNNGDDDLEPIENKKIKQDCVTEVLTIGDTSNIHILKIPEAPGSKHVLEDVNSLHGSDYRFSEKSAQSDNNVISKEVPLNDDNFSKKMDVDSQMLHSDLLSDNLLLQSLPNTRNSVDDLMLTNVDNGSNLLDNSTSSDEVMNVDQFVNERFKKIIEPDIELSSTALNLDLPSLELFQFHTT